MKPSPVRRCQQSIARFFLRHLLDAGTPFGCTLSVPSGGVANQHGTWIFGRDGWCDGTDVKPFELDITDWLHDGDNVIT